MYVRCVLCEVCMVRCMRDVALCAVSCACVVGWEECADERCVHCGEMCV